MYFLPAQKKTTICVKQIVALDGEAGLRFAARIRGKQLDDRSWDWDDHSLVSQAIKLLGDRRVKDALESSSDQDLQRYWQEWQRRENVDEGAPRQSHEARMRAIPLQEIVKAAETGPMRFGPFRGWGMYASTLDLKVVLQRLFEAQDPRIIANYLSVFSKRPLPDLESRFLLYCEHPDEVVRRRAFNALSRIKHPLVRELGLRQIRANDFNGASTSLFVKNYECGDEVELLHRLVVPEDDCERHWLLMDVVDILENNPEADCVPLGVTAYSLTPCSSCRYTVAKLLHERGVAPSWLAEECRWDCEADMRKHFATAS